MDKYPLKKYPIVGACGLNCGLCPRFNMIGSSRCPGCCGPGFWQKHPACSFITCCVKERGLETCAQCPDWSGCGRVARNLNSEKDSFISYQPLPANFAFIREHGLEEFVRREEVKQKFLSYIIENYDDGRAKGFYCLSLQLLPLEKLREVVAMVEARMPETSGIKEKAKLMREAVTHLADSLQIDLRLRK